MKSIRNLIRLKSIAALASAVILLAGCANDSLFGSGSEFSGLACPQVAVLEAPGQLTRFAGGAIGDISDVLFQARMEVTESFCTIEDDTIYVTGSAKLAVVRGPAEKTGKIKFAFFVALLNGRKEVILRQAFPIVMEFKDGLRRIEFEDSVTIQIDRKKGIDPATYSIYGGFEMSPEELDFNRRRLQ